MKLQPPHLNYFSLTETILPGKHPIELQILKKSDAWMAIVSIVPESFTTSRNNPYAQTTTFKSKNIS